jgi:cysteine desulfurase
MAAPRVYLDHNATTPVLAVARAATNDALDLLGNPSSVHRFGAGARQIVDQARDKIAALVGAKTGTVIFTSGGTEANNLAILGADRPVIVSAAEHDSVLAPSRIAINGVTIVPVDADGVVDLAALGKVLAARPGALVSLMLANNETGVCQPIHEAVALARAAGALVHCDAVQGPGKLPVDMDALGVDMLTISAHKFGGPMGAGALVVRKDIELNARQVGGGQEGYRRAGTQNVPGIAGFAAAAQWWIESAIDLTAVGQLRDRLERACQEFGATVFGADAARLPNTSCLTMPGVSSETQVMAFDLDGIALSAGAACSSGKVGPSHVLAAMGAPPDIAASAVRVSLGWDTREDDIDRFIGAWTALYRRKNSGPATRLAS